MACERIARGEDNGIGVMHYRWYQCCIHNGCVMVETSVWECHQSSVEECKR